MLFHMTSKPNVKIQSKRNEFGAVVVAEHSLNFMLHNIYRLNDIYLKTQGRDTTIYHFPSGIV